MLSPQPEIVTLGCRLNLAENKAIRAMLADRDALVVNSCAVTDAAIKQTRVSIRRARMGRPGAKLIVTGCAATIDPAGFDAMAEVDLDQRRPRSHAGRAGRAVPARRPGAGVAAAVVA